MTLSESAELQEANRRFIKRALAAPMLSRERESALGRRWAERKDEAALHELVSSHTRLVISMAARFRGYGLPLGDLVQEGSIGLMEAASRFDPERGIRLSTYARWWIRASIQDYILRNWSVVRLGTTAAEKTLFFNLRRLRARIAAASVGYMSPEERGKIARDLKVGVHAVEAMEGRLSGVDQSLNATIGEESGQEWQDLLEDDSPSPEETVMALRDDATRRGWLHAVLRRLPEREEMIIRARHMEESAVTLAELGRTLGISKERVRQLEQRALGRLQRGLARYGAGESPAAGLGTA